MGNLRSSWFSILVNGSPKGFFQSSRGIKQGDPLSPFLFILLTEAFSRKLKRLVEAGQISGYSLPIGAPGISHLSFADDLIIFTRGERGSLRRLHQFLEDYEKASGQKINKQKSFFISSKRCTVSQGAVISSIMGIRRSQFPFQYLGCSIFQGKRKLEYFQHVLDKIEAKLGGWKQRLLSVGGRIILIRHVLSAIPLHVWAAMEPPKKILRLIESKMASFLWGSTEEGPKRRWRAWDRVTFPVAENGLGIRKISDVLAAFSCKLWWKYNCLQGLWASFMHSLPKSARFSSSWKRLQAMENVGRQNTSVLIGDGSSSFWSTNWSSLGILKDEIMQLQIEYPQLTVFEFFTNKPLYLDAFRLLLSEYVLQSLQDMDLNFDDTEDRLIWHPTSTGHFSLASAYEVVRAKRNAPVSLQHVWNKYIPIKISFFLWRILNYLLPFPEVLMSFGFNFPSKCVGCESVDSLHHYFLTCPLAVTVWSFFHQQLNIPTNSSQDLWQYLQWWWNINGDKSAYSIIVSVLPAFILWELWLARNSFLYDNTDLNSNGIIKDVQQHIFRLSQVFPLFAKTPRDLQLFSSGLISGIHQPKRSRTLLVHWELPSVGVYKLNVDGSSIGNPGPAGGGFIIRDSGANLIAAGCAHFGDGTSFLAELKALILGLEQCVARELYSVIIESDNRVMVEMLKLNHDWPWKYTTILRQAARIIRGRGYQITHTYREGNSVADALANLGSVSKMTASFLFSTMSSKLKGLMVLDQRHFPYIRRAR